MLWTNLCDCNEMALDRFLRGLFYSLAVRKNSQGEGYKYVWSFVRQSGIAIKLRGIRITKLCYPQQTLSRQRSSSIDAASLVRAPSECAAELHNRGRDLLVTCAAAASY